MAEQRPQKRRKVSLRRPITALATGLVLVMVSTGCGSRTIVLSYTPPAATTMTGPRLVILPFDDRRGTEGDEGDPYRVGGIYGGYGNRLAKVMVTRPWPMQLREALAAKFRAEGVEATVADTPDSDARSLGGEIRNFSTESRWGREAHIAAIVRVRSPERVLLEKRIEARESGYDLDNFNTDILEALLNRAFARFVNAVATDPEIRSALGEPTAGR